MLTTGWMLDSDAQSGEGNELSHPECVSAEATLEWFPCLELSDKSKAWILSNAAMKFLKITCLYLLVAFTLANCFGKKLQPETVQ